MKLKMSDYDAMSTEELRAINDMVVKILRSRQNEKIEGIRDQIKVGSKVTVNHPKTQGAILTITEIRRKRATVRSQYGRSLNVPIALVALWKAK
jgi:DNA-binding transcriptional regulator YiaG